MQGARVTAAGSKPSEHARCPPSGYEWWWKCPGVFALPELDVPAVAGKAAEDGTKGHEIGSRGLEVMKAQWYATGKPGSGWTAELEAEAVALGEDYADALDDYFQYIHDRLLDGAELLLIEERVYPLGKDTELGRHCHGTGDALLVFPDEAEVADLKLGAGIWVPASSTQLKIYGLGTLNRAHVAKSVKKVITTVIQPRCERPGHDTIRHVDYTVDELIMDFEWELASKVKATLDPNAPRTPGDHCRFCPRAVFCPEARAKARKLAAEDFAPELAVPQPGQQQYATELGKILDDLDTIDAWAKNVRETAEMAAIAGTEIPGRKLVKGDTHRKWNPETVTNTEPLRVATGLDEEDLYSKKLLSPAQLEKKAGKGVKLDSYYHKPEGAPKLVPLSDDREPVTPMDALNAARKEFAT